MWDGVVHSFISAFEKHIPITSSFMNISSSSRFSNTKLYFRLTPTRRSIPDETRTHMTFESTAFKLLPEVWEIRAPKCSRIHVKVTTCFQLICVVSFICVVLFICYQRFLVGILVACMVKEEHVNQIFKQYRRWFVRKKWAKLMI